MSDTETEAQIDAQTNAQIDDLLSQAKIIAIFGISNKPERDSFKVAQYLKEHGYHILAINPLLQGQTILGEPCYASLNEAKQQSGMEIDIVDCFRKADDIPPIVSEAITVGAKAVWMQLEITNEDAAAQARSAGLAIVMNRCTKIEHKRLHKITD